MRVHDGKARGDAVLEAATCSHRVFDREITPRQHISLHGYPNIVGTSAEVKFTDDEHGVVPRRDKVKWPYVYYT